MKLEHEFCAKFRHELKERGLKYVILELLSSKSEKVPLKKHYLARECSKKPAFAAKMKEAITELKESNRKLCPELLMLRKEVIEGDVRM